MKFQWGGAREENRQILQNHYEWCKDNGYDIKWFKERKGENGRTRKRNTAFKIRQRKTA